MSAMQFGKTDINIQNKIHTMKMTKTKLAKGFTLVELLVVIAIIAALAALSTPVVLKQQKKAASTTAINNAKQIYLLLFEEDQDTGQYPTGASTNEAFRTLFIKGSTTSEDIFYAKTPWSLKPDGDIGTVATSFAEALEAKACGFKYVDNLNSAKASGIPILGAPFLNITTGVSQFDLDTYGNKAVVLTNDGAARVISLTVATGFAPGGGDADIFNSTKLGSVVGDILPAL